MRILRQGVRLEKMVGRLDAGCANFGLCCAGLCCRGNQ